MPRIVLHTRKEPYKLPPQNHNAWICACGLSQNLPTCDGSHCKTVKEKDGIIVLYDKERVNAVREVGDLYGDSDT